MCDSDYIVPSAILEQVWTLPKATCEHALAHFLLSTMTKSGPIYEI